MGEPASEDKCAKFPVIMKIVNISSALLLIGFGLAGLIIQTVNNLSSGKFFLLFSPIFMILVGGLFVAAEFNCQCIIKHFVFLKSYLGRGIFNLFMSSSVFYFFSCGNSNEVVGWISAILIFLLGILYIGIHFCGGQSFKQAQTDTDRPIKEQLR